MTQDNATELPDESSPPTWFWGVSIIALLWFVMDVAAFLMRVLMTEDALAVMPEGQQQLYRSMPTWVNVVFAGEVFGGALGCVGLLLRKKWALPFLIISILGVLSQTFYVWFLSEAISIMGTPAIVMPLVAILIGSGLIALAKSSILKGWLR
ncbi:MAG: hypothetical protein ACI80V_002015 [Rhodothermales bacterium]|jgi:hypothetical protein